MFWLDESNFLIMFNVGVTHSVWKKFVYSLLLCWNCNHKMSPSFLCLFLQIQQHEQARSSTRIVLQWGKLRSFHTKRKIVDCGKNWINTGFILFFVLFVLFVFCFFCFLSLTHKNTTKNKNKTNKIAIKSSIFVGWQAMEDWWEKKSIVPKKTESKVQNTNKWHNLVHKKKNWSLIKVEGKVLGSAELDHPPKSSGLMRSLSFDWTGRLLWCPIKVGQCEFRAHCCVVTASSPPLRVMLSNGKESVQMRRAMWRKKWHCFSFLSHFVADRKSFEFFFFGRWLSVTRKENCVRVVFFFFCVSLRKTHSTTLSQTKIGCNGRYKKMDREKFIVPVFWSERQEDLKWLTSLELWLKVTATPKDKQALVVVLALKDKASKPLAGRLMCVRWKWTNWNRMKVWKVKMLD